jgi:hypothetical protein
MLCIVRPTALALLTAIKVAMPYWCREKKKPPEGGWSFSPLKGTWKQFNQPLVTKRTLSRSEPMSLVNIELHRAVVSHLQ